MANGVEQPARTERGISFTIRTTRLAAAVQDVMKAVATRTTIPILSGIFMKVSKNEIILTGSDADLSIQRTISLIENDEQYGTVEKTGRIVLPAKIFSEIIRKLPGETANLYVDERMLVTIRSQQSEFHLNGLDPEEYPQLPAIEEHRTYRIRAELLKNVIRQTAFAVAHSESRPILTGVHWETDGNKLTCVATDSHRLARKTVAIETDEGSAFQNVVIPGKSLNELGKILSDDREWVEFVVTESQILFRMKNLLFFSRLLDGNYPDTKRLIPTEGKTDIIVNTKEMLAAIERASLLAREGQNNVVKFVTLNDNEIEISSHSPEVGKVYEKMTAHSLEGEEVNISFSARFMMDALKAIDSPEIKIRFTGAMRPFLIHPPESDTVLQLILPVRTY